jgi:signal transduction histidine kinase
MAGESWRELADWAAGLEEFADRAGLDPADPLDAELIGFMSRAGTEVAGLVREHERLAGENEALKKRVRRLETKLHAIINMAADISRYATRAIDKTVSPDEGAA